MKTEKIECDNCHLDFPLAKIYKFSWRYNDKVRRYTSGVKLIHSGYHYLCLKCLKAITKKG